MKKRKHSIEDLFILVTFLVYAIALLLFASLGATVYRTVTSGMQQHQIQQVDAPVTVQIRIAGFNGNLCSGQEPAQPLFIRGRYPTISVDVAHNSAGHGYAASGTSRFYKDSILCDAGDSR